MLEKLKPMIPVAVGLGMAAIVAVMPDARPWACGLTAAVPLLVS